MFTVVSTSCTVKRDNHEVHEARIKSLIIAVYRNRTVLLLGIIYLLLNVGEVLR